MNILELLQRDGFTLKRKASTRGGEYAGACPLCGGTDRFLAWPEQQTECGGGSWWCRGCGNGGDAIQYLKLVKGLKYLEACECLGIQPKRRSGLDWRPMQRSPSVARWTPRETQSPEELWRREAGKLVPWAEKQLRQERNRDALEWLKEKRGFTDETITRFHLGMVPKDIFPSRTAWGLPEVLKENGKPKKLFIPAGIIIPLIHEEQAIRIRIRRWEGDPRYYFLPGGDTRPLLVGADKKAFVVVESELDGVLLGQEVGDVAGVIALGSAQAKPDQEATEALKRAEKILVALDADAAGAKASWGWWPEHFPQAKRWPPVNGKDPGDMALHGEDIRTWVLAGLLPTCNEQRASRDNPFTTPPRQIGKS